MNQNFMLIKKDGKTQEVTLSMDEYMKNKSNHLCPKCCKYKLGVCPKVSAPATEHIDSFPLITGGCQVYCDSNLSIIMYVDGCLRYKKAITKNDEYTTYKIDKNDERIAKGAAVFSKREEEDIRSIYRHHDGNKIPEATVDYAKIRRNHKNSNKIK